MSNKTKIEWCDSTWNPVTGCLHGCEYCYARKMAQRFGRVKIRNFNGQLCELDEPYRRSGDGSISPYPYEFLPTFHRYRLDQPMEWVKARNIFVCSMADLFGEWVPDWWIEEVMAAADKAPQHRYIFLTKNPKRYMEYGVPLDKNKWYGATVTGDEDADRFNCLPAFANTFVSAEPLLGDFVERHNAMFRQIDWIIVGAESGNRKNKVTPKREWVEKIAEEADKNGVPVFMKDSLIPIMGEAGMKRELPDGLGRD